MILLSKITINNFFNSSLILNSFGGFNGHKYISSIEVYYIEYNCWKIMENLILPHAIAQMNGFAVN